MFTLRLSKPAPRRYGCMRCGAGFDELISCIKVIGETRPYKFFHVDDENVSIHNPPDVGWVEERNPT